MVDNGHCSTCQTRNTASSCGSSVQSFKNLFGTRVDQNDTYLKVLDIAPQVTPGQTLITKEIWDQYREILQAIKDYGVYDENNPTQSKINGVSATKGDVVFLNDYNEIRNALDKDSSSGTQLINQEIINTLKTYIAEYKINDTRCNICNTSCQNCQGYNPPCTYSECGQAGQGAVCSGSYSTTGMPLIGCGQAVSSIGTCLAGVTYSARIYKENIQDYTQNALDIINSTKIVEFNYIADPEKNQKIGFIADDTDVQLATKDHNVMDMYNCIGVLLKAVQELSAEIENLKSQLK